MFMVELIKTVEPEISVDILEHSWHGLMKLEA